jgi:hypothetical protein
MEFLSDAMDSDSSDANRAKSHGGVKDMAALPESRQNPIDRVFDRIEDILYETWKETGFGKVTIESERAEKGKGKIQVTVKGSTYYRHYITDEDVREWNSKE